MIFGAATHDQLSTGLEKRNYDNPKVLNRKRNAHACIMSIVFIILYPLSAISIHLPVEKIPFLKNTYLKKRVMAVHVPIQVLATVMLIGATALGIKIAQDLGLLMKPVPAHVIIGLLVFSIILLVQPAMGILQHRYFKKTGGKGWFAYVHRWVGRGAILLGVINNGLGFQLAENDIHVPIGSYIRNFVIFGLLAIVWVGLVAYDEFRARNPRNAVDGEKGEVLKAQENRRTNN
ncbi:hypothetical protein EJ08DRAFT_672558 [Tothia fuscella]|uniref:Cytochrome b561 domain-containing protein n=1 Tax=Tothia fuscella TaxID=1048955 RepID=A0A9P4NIU3_9PEZI|nr:hypothetical protein EJ08DRAFT_672558 [Tothia fuscella]